MINDNIAQLQAQLAEVDDQYLAEQAKNPSGMTGLMAAIEMSKRSKMRSRAAAVSDSYAHKDGTVIQDTLSEFQRAQIPPQQSTTVPQGYADGGRVREEYDALDWRRSFGGGEAPWIAAFKDYTKPPDIRSVDYGPYSGLGSVGRADLARLNYARRMDPQSPSPDYDMPAGPALPPEASPVMEAMSPYDIYSGLPIVRGREGVDLVESAASDAAKIASSIPRSGGSTRSAVAKGNAASAAGTPNFESKYEELLAGIKGDTPQELKPPKELEPIDAKRVERLNRAMALGAMAKQFATQNDFVAGFGTGAADASAIMAAGRHQYQGEVQDQQKIQSQYDIANAEMMARERLADKSAANNINLSRVEAGRDVTMQERDFANRRDLTQMEIAGQERMAAVRAQYDNASKALEMEFRTTLAEMEMADANGMWDKKAALEERLAGIQLEARKLESQADRELKQTSIVSSSVTDIATALIGQGIDPSEAYLQAREAVFGVPSQTLPTVQKVK